jgi:large subunit ribosomal protein L10
VHKDEKQQVVAELTERLRATETLIVADYRGLTNKQVEELRTKLIEAGARLTVVKNTLTRRAAEEAGADALLTLLEGPTAIAFIEADGDPVAVAKALGDTARDTKVLALRGGVMQGATISAEQVEELGKLPPVEVLRGQLLGVVVAPLTTVVGLLSAPLRDLVGLIDARIEQLEEQGDVTAQAAVVETETPAEEAESTEKAPAEEADEPVATTEPAGTEDENPAEEDAAASEPAANEEEQD